eukprot:CAMPEP_0197539556 /NCGR_PEP_ID=MMETSP1318-20131121/63100_1 /TAXON_ID=552666 /ORGANISM="Partenskyella glossopodia, Strain RCC365" /LENGTH=356 /DNA_ID=CAMNT_0043098307 /DNA_START=48 /DNA_END=1118 /DNA_ORIENTATION=+
MVLFIALRASKIQKPFLSTLASTRPKATVIGGTGFVGSNVVLQLLKKGYDVRATCRDVNKSQWLKQLSERETNVSSNNVELVPLTLTAESPPDKLMDTLLEGTEAVFFCAGFEHQDPSTIDFMVKNAVAVCKAAKRQKCECVVLTSSGGSTNPIGHKNEVPKNEILHWSDPENQKSKGRFSPAAKTLMELNSLSEYGRNSKNEVVDNKKAEGSPRLCIMNPNLILGPQLHPGPISGNSLPWIVSILKGEKMNSEIPNDSMSIIDVRDLAALHVACASDKTASGRYFGVNKSFPWEEILSGFEKAYPSYKKPKRFEGRSAVPTQFDFSRRDSLGLKLRSLDQTLADLVEFLSEKGSI